MLVTTANFQGAMDWIARQSILALDTETNGLQPFHGDKIVGVSVGDHLDGWYFPFGHGEGENLDPSYFRALLNGLAHKKLVMFNGTFDLNFLQKAGMPRLCAPRFEEVQVAAHLHNENDFNKYLGRAAGLKELADKYLGSGSSADEEELREQVAMRFGKAKARTKAWKGLMWNLPAALVEPYASADAVLTMQLRSYFLDQITKEGLQQLYWEMCEYTLLLQQISFDGIKIDRPLCEELYTQTKRDAVRAMLQFRKMTGIEDFNLNSSPQLHDLFGEASVRADLLKEWALTEPGEDEDAYRKKNLAIALLNFRAADKMHGSYFAKYLPLLDRESLLHPSLNVTGTETGRLSCSNPNLQAIPRDVEKHKVKLLFTPREEGGSLVEMDLSQAEIRLASFYGREFLMAEHLAHGRDIHTETARLIGVERSTAKRINFSAIYGIGARKYSATYGVPFEESRRNLDAYHATYPGFRKLYSTAEQHAARNRVLVLPSGRRRHYTLPYGHLQDKDRLQARIMNANLELETHKASSNLVQGMVAAIMMKAMLRISRELPEMRMVLTVHDSLLFELSPGLPEGRRCELIRAARQMMEDPAPGDPAYRFTGHPGHPDCPIKVDVKLATERWGEAEEWGEE